MVLLVPLIPAFLLGSKLDDTQFVWLREFTAVLCAGFFLLRCLHLLGGGGRAPRLGEITGKHNDFRRYAVKFDGTSTSVNTEDDELVVNRKLDDEYRKQRPRVGATAEHRLFDFAQSINVGDKLSEASTVRLREAVAVPAAAEAAADAASAEAVTAPAAAEAVAAPAAAGAIASTLGAVALFLAATALPPRKNTLYWHERLTQHEQGSYSAGKEIDFETSRDTAGQQMVVNDNKTPLTTDCVEAMNGDWHYFEDSNLSTDLTWAYVGVCLLRVIELNVPVSVYWYSVATNIPVNVPTGSGECGYEEKPCFYIKQVGRETLLDQDDLMSIIPPEWFGGNILPPNLLSLLGGQQASIEHPTFQSLKNNYEAVRSQGEILSQILQVLAIVPWIEVLLFHLSKNQSTLGARFHKFVAVVSMALLLAMFLIICLLLLAVRFCDYTRKEEEHKFAVKMREDKNEKKQKLVHRACRNFSNGLQLFVL
jgi:hypothetical protein